MTEHSAADGQIDQRVKARWLAIGVSQPDLAEVLDAAFKSSPERAWESDPGDAGRLAQIAEALDVPLNSWLRTAVGTAPEDPGLAPAQGLPQSLIELRLLRAFHELSDIRSKRMLVHLAEHIARRQAGRRGDAG
jgi:transcriptional regulator with XRE-family HTH domain